MLGWLETGWFADLGRNWMALLLDAGVKGFVILGVAGIVTFGMRRTSAAARHLAWSLGVVGVLALPVLSVALPGWQVMPPWMDLRPQPVAGPVLAPTQGEEVGMPVSASEAARLDASRAIGVTETFDNAPVPPAAPARRATPADQLPAGASAISHSPQGPSTEGPRRRPSLPLWSWVLLVWAIGALLAMAPACAGLVSVWYLRRRARRITEGPRAALLARLCRELGVKRRVDLLQSEARPMPMTWGVLRPRLLLPDEVRGWSAERLRVVLLHELGHVRRWDALTELLARIARVLYWFNPLIWVAARRMVTERERACDDLVLSGGSPPTAYADHLLGVVAGLRANRLAGAAAISMARQSKLERRLRAILDKGRSRRTLTRAVAGLFLVVAAAVLLPVAMMRAAERPDDPVMAPAEATRSPAPAPAAAPAKPTVSGTVVNPHGFPRAHVEFGTSLPNGLWRGPKSGRDGRFTLTNVAPDPMLRIAYSQATRRMGLFALPTDGPLTVRLDWRAGEVDGRVVDSSGRGVGSREVQVRIETPDGKALVSDPLRTDGNGYYEIATCPVGAGLALEARLLSASGDPGPWTHRASPSAGQIAVEMPDLVDANVKPIEGQVPPAGRAAYGGRVVNEDGEPVKAAEIRLLHEIGGCLHVRNSTTDADGRWTRRLPGELKNLSAQVLHAEYVGGRLGGRVKGAGSADRMLDGTAVLVLKRGHEVAGFVHDPRGRPIGDALVLTQGARGMTGGLGEPIEDSTMARTDRKGRFRVGGVPAGKSDLIVYATGHGPRAVPVRIGPRTGPVDIELQPGGTIRGQVVDPEGKPVEGARATADDWRIDADVWNATGDFPLPRQAMTDGDGRFELFDLPMQGSFSVYYGKSGAGFLTTRRKDLACRRDPYRLTIHRPTAIEGRVIDAATGRPAGHEVRGHPGDAVVGQPRRFVR